MTAGHDHVIVLKVADTRGVMYAINEFGDRFLNVPPLWIFASWTPPHQVLLRVPDGTKLRFGTPATRFRTRFVNDADYLRPWIARTPEDYDALLETLLRLKFNTLDMDSFCDVPGPEAGLLLARACRDRGITVTTTHIAPFDALRRQVAPLKSLNS